MIKFGALAVAVSLFVFGVLQISPAYSQQSGAGASSKVPVTTVVTVLGPSFTVPPPLGKEDIAVYTGKQTREDVTAWTSAQGESGPLDLAILIDDLDNPDIGNRFDDVRKFIDGQSKNTRIGIFYADNGAARPAVDFTVDHAAAAKALRQPLGFGASPVSIYQSLLDLFKKWRANPNTRREVFVIADGIDRFRGDPNSPDVALTIEKAQRSGIVIHSLYVRAVDHFGRNLFRVNLGAGNLGQMADATGGEFFSQGFETPVSFFSYLQQLDMILHNQYLLTFTTARAAKKSGDLRAFRIQVEEKRAEITHASAVFVPGP